MKTTFRIVLALLVVPLVVFAQARKTPFDPDSAAAQLRILSEDIGPRPMGSPSEQRALAHAVESFKSWGLDDAYVLGFTVAPADRSGQPGPNTQSGTAVGVKKGKTGRIIVIGGHIDSAGPEIPGANDDGSGSAVVLELARIMAEREWESTIVFCLFGGEESGLKGSYHFVQNFPLIDSVAVMLQVDMANGVDWLIPMYDLARSSTPEWLVNASYEEFERLGYEGLDYPTHFSNLNSALGGAASSDHQPFLERNIPAIDFTSDVRDPIHSPQDSWTWFVLGGLERSGDLVYRLVERFDSGIPETRTGAYMTVQIGSTPWLIPYWFLWTIVALSFASGMWTLVQLRRERTEIPGQPKPKIPGLKVALLTLGVVLVGWLTEDLMSSITGLRSPWYGEPVPFLGLGFLGSLLAAVTAGILGRKMGLSRDPYRYYLKGAIWFGVLISLASLTGPRLAVYPAIGLIACSFALVLHSSLLQTIVVAVGAYPTLRIVFSEVYEFIARTFAMIPPESGISNVLLIIVLTLFVWGLIMPFALCFAGILRSPKAAWPIRFSFSHFSVWGSLSIIFVVSAWYFTSTPAYSDFRPRNVEIMQEFDTDADTVRTVVKSVEYMTGAVIQYQETDTLIGSQTTLVRLPKRSMLRSTWMTTDGSQPMDLGNSGAIVGTNVAIQTSARPLSLSVRYTTRHAGIVSADAGTRSVALKDGAATLRWYSFPDTLISIPIVLRLSQPDTVIETIEATFVGQATPVTFGSPEPTNVHSRTVVRARRNFAVGRLSTPLQE